MSTHRRRPLDVDARQVAADTAAETAAWCGGRLYVVTDTAETPPAVSVWIEIPTLGGAQLENAYLGQWIIRAGDDVVVRPAAAFAAEYEPIDDQETTP